jgi:hypothetical protein
VVLDSFARVLVRKLPLLLFRIPSPDDAYRQEPGVKNMVGRVLIVCWAVVAGCVLLLIFIPKPAKLPSWLPDPQTLRLFLILLTLLSTPTVSVDYIAKE